MKITTDAKMTIVLENLREIDSLRKILNADTLLRSDLVLKERIKDAATGVQVDKT